MIGDLPISAYLLCYGPLALTIIGFIVFAAMTDTNARRRYLRRLDLRTDSERQGAEPPEVKRRFSAETPSGVEVTIEPSYVKTGPDIIVTPAAPSSDALPAESDEDEPGK